MFLSWKEWMTERKNQIWIRVSVQVQTTNLIKNGCRNGKGRYSIWGIYYSWYPSLAGAAWQQQIHLHWIEVYLFILLLTCMVWSCYHHHHRITVKMLGRCDREASKPAPWSIQISRGSRWHWGLLACRLLLHRGSVAALPHLRWFPRRPATLRTSAPPALSQRLGSHAELWGPLVSGTLSFHP